MIDRERFNLRVGIIGCGNIATVHLKHVIKYVGKDRIALCDSNAFRLEDLGAKTGIVNRYDDVETLIDNFHPDVIHVLTPPSTHKDVSVKCLQKNCHVLIEKPMCISLREADEIINTAQDKRRLVCIDHMRLFEPLMIKARKMLYSGTLGSIVNISASYSYDYFKRVSTDPASKWMSQLPGGPFFDVMPHLLCLLEEFMPDLMLEQKVYRKNKNQVLTDLWCIFSSSFGTSTLHMSLRIFPLKNCVVFECEKGSLTIDFRNFLIVTRKQYGLPNALERVAENLSVGVQILLGTIGSVLNFARGRLDPYAGLDYIIRHFYRAITQEGASPVPPEKGRRLLALTREIFPQGVNKTKGEKISNRRPEADVLVTGGTGFIGRRLVKNLLEQGHKVRVLTHRNLGDEELHTAFQNHVDIIHGDISNSTDVDEACKGVEIVYHLAAAMQGSWNYHLDTTISGTKKILESAVKMGVRRFVYVSTLSVYNAARYLNNSFINEDFPDEEVPEKRGSYSHAKLKAERIVRTYMNKTKMSISILRPGLVYGPGRKPFLADVGYRLGRHFALVLGMGGRKLPLVYVDNVVDSLILSGKLNGRAKGIFNVVDGDYPTQRDFIKVYKNLTGERIFTIYIPTCILSLALWVADLIFYLGIRKSPSFRHKLMCVTKSVKHDTRRSEEILGWKQGIKFEEGMRLSIQGKREVRVR